MPPILPGTLGRIAHEISIASAQFGEGGAILSSEEAAHLFELGARKIIVAGHQIEATVDVIRDLHSMVSEREVFAAENRELAKDQLGHLIKAILGVEELASAQRITQDSVDDLT
jgi:hypothetical protein